MVDGRRLVPDPDRKTTVKNTGPLALMCKYMQIQAKICGCGLTQKMVAEKKDAFTRTTAVDMHPELIKLSISAKKASAVPPADTQAVVQTQTRYTSAAMQDANHASPHPGKEHGEISHSMLRRFQSHTHNYRIRRPTSQEGYVKYE